MSSIVLSIFLLSIGASFIQRTTGFGFGIFIMTMLGAYVFKHIPNRIFRYIVYAYICISGIIILMTN